ncbi:MAG: hypothetical protein SPG06_01260 [Eubacteriales bacterium]|nr:hypothetical protein [Eubacteriales bacterium]
MESFVFGYNQIKARELGLNLEDLLILKYINDFSPKMKTIIKNNKLYFWIDYKYLLCYLPIITKTPENLRLGNFKRLLNANVLEKITIPNPKILNRRGVAVFYAFSTNYYILLPPKTAVVQPPKTAVENKYNNDIYINNKEKIYKKESLKKNEFRTNSERKYTQEQLNNIFNDMYDYDNLDL